jgi:GT2 family glycosyltransferase
MEPVPATIVVPTRNRAGYLDVALASFAAQAATARAEVVVVLDGPDAASAAVAARHGARIVALPHPEGPNAARNAGIAAARGELIVLVDDDVAAPPTWLPALLAAAAATPERDVFGGPIRAAIERRRVGLLGFCGREKPPLTTLDAGFADRDIDVAWSANLAIRRAALETVGGFDEQIAVGAGDEEEWQERYRSTGSHVRYVAAAGLEHRRTREDATLRSFMRSAYHRGRAGRRNDARKGAVAPLAGELRVLAGCLWHVPRHRCANGFVMAAHTLGRIREGWSRGRGRATL